LSRVHADDDADDALARVLVPARVRMRRRQRPAACGRDRAGDDQRAHLQHVLRQRGRRRAALHGGSAPPPAVVAEPATITALTDNMFYGLAPALAQPSTSAANLSGSISAVVG